MPQKTSQWLSYLMYLLPVMWLLDPLQRHKSLSFPPLMPLSEEFRVPRNGTGYSFSVLPYPEFSSFSVFRDSVNISQIQQKVAFAQKWHKNFTTRATEEYFKFLYVYRKYGGPVVPSYTVDQLWHAHILDTKKYLKDCRLLFGYFLHHRPSYSKSDQPRLADQFSVMKSRFYLEFGPDPPQKRRH